MVGHRGRLAAAALAAVALAALPAAGAKTPAAKVIGTRGKVVSISADGGRVAINATVAGNPECDSGSVWTPSTGAVVRFQDSPCGPKQSDDQYVGLTLAGTTAAWVDYDYGNHAYCAGPYTATLAKPKPVPIADYCDGTEDTSDTYYEFKGDGALLAGLSYLRCEASCGPDYDKTYDTDIAVYRLAGGVLKRILAAPDDTTLLDADAGRILILEPGKKLVVLDAAGKQVGALTLPEVGEARLSGSKQVVAVSQGTTLTTVDVATGKPVKATKMQGEAKLMDVETGVAVYFSATEVHLLTLATGRDRVVVKQRGLVQADLEPAGLFYAYDVPGGAKPGRVAFVAAAALPK